MPRQRPNCCRGSWRQRKLVRQDDVNELIDQIAGVTLTHLSGMAARCSRDMVVRRNIDTDGDADQARDKRRVQQGSRRTQRATAR
jgi:hypothetical protein